MLYSRYKIKKDVVRLILSALIGVQFSGEIEMKKHINIDRDLLCFGIRSYVDKWLYSNNWSLAKMK